MALAPLVGLGLGLLITHTGNLLPTLRPFSGFASLAASTERFRGWLLALTGIAWIALFLLLPLPQARVAGGLIGSAAAHLGGAPA